MHSPQSRHVTLAMHEPWGVVGIVCPDAAPLLALVSLVAPAIAAGNAVVAVPSARHPLVAADLCQVLDTSDVPAGVVNLVTGAPSELAPTLARHAEVAALWHAAPPDLAREIEAGSCGNLKYLWNASAIADRHAPAARGRPILRHAMRVKNIWVPYGA